MIAAAPGQVLPRIPKPITIFDRSILSVKIGDKEIWTSDQGHPAWSTSAPFRSVTIRDAIADLPPIKSGDQVSI